MQNYVPPLIGAAMRLPELPQFVDWLAADQRDLEIQDPGDPDYLDSDWRPHAEAGRALLDRAGYTGRLGIHATYEGMELFVRDRLVRAAIVTRFKQSLEFGAALGATHMVIHSPFVSFGSGFGNYSPQPFRAPIMQSAHAILDQVLPTAEKMGCTLVIEGILDKNPHPVLDLVRSFNSPYVRASVDTGHAYLMEMNGGASPQQWIVDAWDMLAHVHLQDVDGHADRHWAVGDGNLNWTAIFRALSIIPASPRLILEMADVNDIPRSMAWLTARGLGR